MKETCGLKYITLSSLVGPVLGTEPGFGEYSADVPETWGSAEKVLIWEGDPEDLHDQGDAGLLGGAVWATVEA